MDTINSSLIEAIREQNDQEAIYWAHLLKNSILSNHYNEVIVPLNEIFEGFALLNTELSSILAKIAWETIKAEDFPVIMEKYGDKIISVFNNSSTVNEEVLKLCLNIIFKLGLQSGHSKYITENTIHLLIRNILSSDYSVSGLLVEHIQALPEGIFKEMFQGPILELYSKSKHDGAVQFRFLELFYNVKHQESLLITFMDDLKSIISDTRDPLLSLSGLQTIQDCIKTKDEFDLFVKFEVIDLLISQLSHDTVANLHKCKILDIFAETAQLNCFQFTFIQTKGIDRLVKILLSEEGVAHSAIYCASTLASISDDLDLLKDYEQFLFHGNSSVQLAALHGLGIYFASSSRARASLLTHFLSYDREFFKWLEGKTKSTFDDQKSAAYFSLKSILSLSDCLKMALNTSALIGNLLQRDLDDSLLGLQWKYDIFEQISLSSQLIECLNGPLQEQIKNYLLQGVIFVKRSTRVAFESA